jgi:uncharacterized protein YccT (UPF0319 family)
MATLTIIKDDNFVKRDGVELTIDCSGLASNVHAVQWNGSAGEVEYNDGTANAVIDSISAYSSITDAFATAKSEADKAATDAAKAEAAQKLTYQYKRTYPSINEQMDMQYHDAVDGTTTWKDAIKAVKDANPKP